MLQRNIWEYFDCCLVIYFNCYKYFSFYWN